jgi:hypothetical protein
MKKFNDLFISNLETTSRDNEERLAKVIKYPQPSCVAELGASFMETTTQWNDRTFPLSLSMAGNSNSLKDRQDLLTRNQKKWNAQQLYASSYLPAFMENYEEK